MDPEAVPNNRKRKRSGGSEATGTLIIPPKAETSTHLMETFTQLQVFQRKGLLCDLVLVPQDDPERRLPVHSCIMAASSLYLKAMLTGQVGSKTRDLSQAKGPHEVLLAFDFSVLATLVNFSYGGGLEICGETVAALLAASDFLRMEDAVAACCSWLLQNVSVENAFMVRDLAIEFRQTELLESVTSFLLENFEHVMRRPEFAALHYKDLDLILGSDHLVVHGEMDVYRALMSWVIADWAARKDDFCRLFLKHIRLEFFRSEELLELLSSESIASRSLQVSQVCEDALRDLCAVTAAGSTISTAAAATATALSLASSGKLVGRNRRWKVDRSIYLLGGRNQEQTHLRKVRHYLAHKLSWAPREEMNTPRAFLGVATLDNTIYAVGGYNEQDSFLDSVEYYSPTLRTWQYARRLNVARASLGLCTLQNRLIAVGGENRAVPNLPDQSPIYLNSVEVFDRTSNMWRMASEMSTPRSFIGLGVVGTSVLAIGGYDGEDYLQTVERYDGNHDSWQVVAPLNAPRSCCGVATYDNCVYVAGGYNTDHCLRSVEMFDPRANRWRNVAPLEVERSYLSMVEFSGSLFAIGGLDTNENALEVVEKYDPALNRWFEVAPLSAPVYACGLCVVDEET